MTDANIEIVKKLYSTGQAIDDMHKYTNNGLKKWEINVASIFPLNSHILNIGCGMGREAFSLYDMGFSITAIDISLTVIETAIAIAKKNQCNINFLLSDGKNLSFKDNTFDVIIIWAQTFGLFYGSESQNYILNECYRVLKKGGILSLSGHNKDFIILKHPQYVVDETKFYPYADTECYWELFTLSQLIETTERAGFKVFECKAEEVFIQNENPIIHCECRK